MKNFIRTRIKIGTALWLALGVLVIQVMTCASGQAAAMLLPREGDLSLNASPIVSRSGSVLQKMQSAEELKQKKGKEAEEVQNLNPRRYKQRFYRRFVNDALAAEEGFRKLITAVRLGEITEEVDAIAAKLQGAFPRLLSRLDRLESLYLDSYNKAIEKLGEETKLGLWRGMILSKEDRQHISKMWGPMGPFGFSRYLQDYEKEAKAKAQAVHDKYRKEAQAVREKQKKEAQMKAKAKEARASFLSMPSSGTVLKVATCALLAAQTAAFVTIGGDYDGTSINPNGQINNFPPTGNHTFSLVASGAISNITTVISYPAALCTLLLNQNIILPAINLVQGTRTLTFSNIPESNSNQATASMTLVPDPTYCRSDCSTLQGGCPLLQFSAQDSAQLDIHNIFFTTPQCFPPQPTVSSSSSSSSSTGGSGGGTGTGTGGSSGGPDAGSSGGGPSTSTLTGIGIGVSGSIAIIFGITRETRERHAIRSANPRMAWFIDKSTLDPTADDAGLLALFLNGDVNAGQKGALALLADQGYNVALRPTIENLSKATLEVLQPRAASWSWSRPLTWMRPFYSDCCMKAPNTFDYSLLSVRMDKIIEKFNTYGLAKQKRASTAEKGSVELSPVTAVSNGSSSSSSSNNTSSSLSLVATSPGSDPSAKLVASDASSSSPRNDAVLSAAAIQVVVSSPPTAVVASSSGTLARTEGAVAATAS